RCSRVRCTRSTATRIPAVQSSARRVSCELLNIGNTRARYRCSEPERHFAIRRSLSIRRWQQRQPQAGMQPGLLAAPEALDQRFGGDAWRERPELVEIGARFLRIAGQRMGGGETG